MSPVAGASALLIAAWLLGACTEDANEAIDRGDAEAQMDGATVTRPDSGAIPADASTSQDANEPVSTDVAPMDGGSDAGSDAATDGSAPAFKIGGTLSGLAPGASVVLQNVDGDALTLTTNGAFSFRAPFVTGAAYDVTVRTNPSTPAQTQTCTVAAGSGNVGHADITSVVVTCTNNAYAIGGTLTGLAPGKSVSLENQDGSPLTLTTNGAFAFGPRQTQGTIFLIKVSSPPVGETCTVTGGSGTVDAADVTSATVTCTPLAYAVGGAISGNVGPVSLTNAGQSLSTAGPKFSFPSQEHGSLYDVNVTSSPLGQTCTVANGSGTVEGPIANVLVSCVNDLPPADLYVDAKFGSDANPGNSGAPFKTITFAMSVVAAKAAPLRVQVMPGTYDKANGEVFPITVPPDCILTGDEDKRGKGGLGTTIAGVGPTASFAAASLLLATGARISGFGFAIQSLPPAFGVIADSGGTVSLNTFSAGYGGVYTIAPASPLIEHNTFRNSSVGIHGSGSPSILANEFQETMSGAVNMGGAGSACLIKGNTIEGNGTVGVIIQAGSCLIDGNTFTRVNGYLGGAIAAYFAATPIVRNNVIQSTAQLAVYAKASAAPNLGTAIDPGNNVLGSGAVIGFGQDSSKPISAIGNTWAQTPPVCGSDIKVGAGAGMVTFATMGGTTTCP